MGSKFQALGLLVWNKVLDRGQEIITPSFLGWFWGQRLKPKLSRRRVQILRQRVAGIKSVCIENTDQERSAKFLHGIISYLFKCRRQIRGEKIVAEV